MMTPNKIKVTLWCGMRVFRGGRSGILFTALLPDIQFTGYRIFLHSRNGKSISIVNFQGSPDALRPEQFPLGSILEFRSKQAFLTSGPDISDLILRRYMRHANVLLEEIFRNEGMKIWLEIVQQSDSLDELMNFSPIQASEVVARKRVERVMRMLFSNYVMTWLDRLPAIWLRCRTDIFWRATKVPLVL
jgi:hypothetical protein